MAMLAINLFQLPILICHPHSHTCLSHSPLGSDASATDCLPLRLSLQIVIQTFSSDLLQLHLHQRKQRARLGLTRGFWNVASLAVRISCCHLQISLSCNIRHWRIAPAVVCFNAWSHRLVGNEFKRVVSHLFLYADLVLFAPATDAAREAGTRNREAGPEGGAQHPPGLKP
jgi:hypothetical protein